jgi:hypothetical protein
MRTVRVFIIGVAMLACAVIGIAQTSEPTPFTMPAQPARAAAGAAKEQEELAANIQDLEELKAENEEILKQQQATLDTLDQLQRDAEQIRIFSKRG